MKKITKATCAALIGAGLSLAAVQAQAASDMEKCYGIAKAGANDCGGKSTLHSCQGQSTKDADVNDWLMVPAGLCAKIAGGSSTPGDKA